MEVGGTTYPNITVPASGIWTVTLNSPLTNGTYTATATATDAAGNTATDTSTFRVDTTAPAVSIDAPANGGNPLNTPVTTVSGTAEPGSKLTVEVGGTTYTDVPVENDGSWKVTLNSPLTNGTYTATATATDAVGNTATDTSTFTVDTTPPAVAITAPTNGRTSSQEVTEVTGTAEPGSKVTVVVEGTTYPEITVPTSGIWTVPLNSPLTNGGPYTATATATDAAGNTATATSTFSVDTVAPAAPVIETPRNGAVLSASPAAISGTAEKNSTLTLVLTTGTTSTTYGPIPVNEDGKWTFTPHAAALWLPHGDGPHSRRGRQHQP
ncbi:Ig-like domain-containing protein [Cystobacter fuscus]